MLVGNNQDLLLEILSLLPTKSVIRFKGVSKLWLSIISDPYFIKTHTNNGNPQAISGFTCSNPEDYIHYYYLFDGPLSSAPDLSISILKHDAAQSLGIHHYNFKYNLHVCVARSFYGLLICPVVWKLSAYRFSLKLIYIFNPVTMQYRRISEVEPNWCPLDMILTPDHKLIMLSSDNIYFYQIRIYFNNSWKIMYTFQDHELVYNQPTKGIYLNGKVYWVLQIGHTRTRSIFSLNVESFEVQKLAWPDYCDDFYKETLYFGECGGRLHLIMEQKVYDFIFHIMEIKEDFSGWNHLHCIDLKFMRDILSPALSPALSRIQTITDEREYDEEDDTWDYIERAYEDHGPAVAPIQMVLGERSEDCELLFTMTLPKFEPNRLIFFRRAAPRIFSYNIGNKISYREIMNVTHKGRFYTAARINTYYPMLTPP